MTLVDTSVWIEFLRGTTAAATTFVRDHVGVDLATTEPIAMELLAGARPGAHTDSLDLLLASQGWHRVHPATDYRGAVDVFHVTRRAGHQPRSLQDCLIAAVALRCGVPLAHRDRDFARIAGATGLQVVDLRD